MGHKAGFQVRSATKDDASSWIRMRDVLWPDHASAWHAEEVEKYFAGQLRMPLEVLIAVEVAYADPKALVGKSPSGGFVVGEGAVAIAE